MTNHSITPPKELINVWRSESSHQDYCGADEYLYHKIAEWGWQQRNATVPQELQEFIKEAGGAVLR